MKGWHARRDQGASPEGSALSRRTLTKGAVWTTPLLVTAVAAPAYAASGPCVPGTVALTQNTSTTQPTSGAAGPAVDEGHGDRRILVDRLGGDATPGETGQVRATQFDDATAAYPNYNYLKLHHDAGDGHQ